MKMGFSSNGPGKAAHDALLARQDAELRLMDIMKRCLSAKVKSDKEYAVTLSSVAVQGQKMDKCEDLTNSAMAALWKTMMEELENTSKLIKQNAEALESRALERLTVLISERRKARKLYQEDHNRFSSQFSQISEEVGRKQNDYQKCLESYKQMRTKFEENYLKCPTSRGSRKLDETCEKYSKACRRLHRAHNEYVLLLAEASECEKALRTSALPALSEHQRKQGEAFIATLRAILLDVVLWSDLNSDKFKDIQKKITNAFQSLKPQDEYRDFDKFISPPSSPIMFEFDRNLVDDDTPGKLLPDKLTVDNLTVEWLKEKLSDLEAQLQDNREKQQAIQGPEIIGNGICKNNNTANGVDRSSPPPTTLPQNTSEPIRLIELRISERKCTRQTDLIKAALAELGGEEVPDGCPELPDSLEPEINTEQDRSSVGSKTSIVLRRHLHTILPPTKPLFRLFRSPFRRKSLPSSPALPPKSRAFRSGSEGRTMVKKRRGRFRKRLTVKKSDDIESTTDLSSDSDSNTASVPINGVLTERSLEEEEWFHGVLPREEVVRLLRTDGDYLVRETTRNLERQTVLSVCWGGHKHFIVQTTPEGHYRFEGAAFPSVRELIEWQRSCAAPVTARSGALLRRAVPRERWELNNDDVELLQEIGRGNFSDVYKAKLKPTNQIVAVKRCRITLPEEQKKTFLQEGRILKQYDHPNIVRLIGICVQKQPIMIVMELVPGGSLLNYLRKNASTGALTERALLALCRDAASGMRYLASRHCIHRDLAARNCLVGDDCTVKISDFGMSREEKEYIVSGGMKQIPIKWTAPEALNFGKYTSLCDVWSYGVLMWEIFSKGDTPYSGMSNSRAREKIDAGYRMPAPEGCPNDIYLLMLRCWEYEPENRPHFDQIYNIIDNLFNVR